MNTVIDLNSRSLADQPLNKSINDLIERSAPPEENFRQYLGASSIGGMCDRKVQYDWFCGSDFPMRTLDIFERGHFGEALTIGRMKAAGFEFAAPDRCKFSICDDMFRGHADGVLTAGPHIAALRFPCVFEHKALNAKGYRAIERDGLTGLYHSYACQISLYQSYLNCPVPALCCVLNADTCHRLFFLVPFNQQLAQQTSDRAARIIAATRAGELLPRIVDNPDDWRCKMCGHKARCYGENGNAAA